MYICFILHWSALEQRIWPTRCLDALFQFFSEVERTFLSTNRWLCCKIMMSGLQRLGLGMYLLIRKSTTKEENLIIWFKTYTHLILNQEWKPEEEGANLSLQIWKHSGWQERDENEQDKRNTGLEVQGKFHMWRRFSYKK